MVKEHGIDKKRMARIAVVCILMAALQKMAWRAAFFQGTYIRWKGKNMFFTCVNKGMER